MAESFNRASVALSTTSITDVYQCPTSAAINRSVVLSCIIANTDSASRTVTVTISDSSNSSIARIANTIAIPANASLELIPNKLVLKQGEKIRATAGTAATLEVTVSALEIT